MTFPFSTASTLAQEEEEERALLKTFRDFNYSPCRILVYKPVMERQLII
jgi:hypothetical protein